MSSLQLERKAALVIHNADNVAVALADLWSGDPCVIRYNDREELITVTDSIAFGHKFALRPIGKDESVLKYGEEIGKMSVPVNKGEFIHNHNMYCERGKKE
jgi:altronate dehydratase small subunit